ncbi:MAG TPA: hypothetical protein VGT43_12660 [Burkholderiales bacterium]|jgi:hypothetical protein|nr:hypothetical protein [Burkholderiales bacterium]
MGAMNEFKVLDPNGHTRTSWDTSNPEEVERARRIFNDLMNRGYRAFRMNGGAGESVPKSAFDPKDKETLFVPPIRAG